MPNIPIPAPMMNEAQRALDKHPQFATAIQQLDAVRRAFDATLSGFYGARPADLNEALFRLETAAEALRYGVITEVVRAGEPESDVRALILEELTNRSTYPIEAGMLYRQVVRRDPRLRDRKKTIGRTAAAPSAGPTYKGPVWTALNELKAEGLVDSLNPGGGYTVKYRLSKKARKEAANV